MSNSRTWRLSWGSAIILWLTETLILWWKKKIHKLGYSQTWYVKQGQTKQHELLEDRKTGEKASLFLCTFSDIVLNKSPTSPGMDIFPASIPHIFSGNGHTHVLLICICFRFLALHTPMHSRYDKQQSAPKLRTISKQRHSSHSMPASNPFAKIHFFTLNSKCPGFGPKRLLHSKWQLCFQQCRKHIRIAK